MGPKLSNTAGANQRDCQGFCGCVCGVGGGRFDWRELRGYSCRESQQVRDVSIIRGHHRRDFRILELNLSDGGGMAEGVLSRED